MYSINQPERKKSQHSHLWECLINLPSGKNPPGYSFTPIYVLGSLCGSESISTKKAAFISLGQSD